MIRRQTPDRQATRTLVELKSALITRRRVLVQAAGGSVALLFGLRAAGADDYNPWPTLDAVTRHLLPSEPDSPGAVEIRALDYLRFVSADPQVDREEREFILQGNRWLDELAQGQHGSTFPALAPDQKEELLRQVAKTAAGENWVSTLLGYLFEALLTAPTYGGNPDGVGWRWLQHVPGYPRPPKDKTYPRLLS